MKKRMLTADYQHYRALMLAAGARPLPYQSWVKFHNS